MAQDLMALLEGLDDLIPKERNKTLINLWLSHPDAEKRFDIRTELDSRLATFAIVPQDYALVLRASQSISWALDALKKYKEKKIVTAAIDVLEMTWNKHPKAFLNEVGGHEGIIDLLDNVLPQIHVVRLFRAFGRPRPLLPEHVSIVDAIFHAIFPAFGFNSPISRHARVAVDHALTGASLDVVRVVLYCWEAKLVHKGTWTKLALRRPYVLKEILLGQFEGLTPSSITGRVDDPSHIFSAIDSVLKREKDFQFLGRFFAAFGSYLSRNSQRQISDPVLANLNTKYLLRITSVILKKETKIEDRISRVISMCDLLKAVMVRYGQEKLEWYQADSVISLVCEEFGRSRWAAYWTVASPKDLTNLEGSATVVGLLLAVFKHISYSGDTFTRPRITECAKLLPRKARFPFCHILHVAKTGESLAEDPANKPSFPAFSPELLAILHPTHGRLLLEIGLRSREDSFISNNWLGAKNKIDTQNLLLAAWVGSERGTSGDLGFTDEASAKACTAQVYLFKSNASRSKEADDRLYNSKMALLTCKLAHSPALFDEIMSWALNRYAKDVETGGFLFDFIVQNRDAGFDRFLAGPIGLYVSNATRSAFSKDALAAWCSRGVDTLKTMIHIFRVWIKEPNHGQGTHTNIKSQYDKFCTFYFKVVEARIKLIEHIYPIFSDNLNELRTIMLDPMVDFFTELETFKVIENPDPLQFNLTTPSPWKLQDHLQISRRISSVVLPFLMELGKQREKLYRKGRQSITSVNEDLLMQRWYDIYDNYRYDHSILPCGLVIASSTINLQGVANRSTYDKSQKKHLCQSIDLSHGLGEYVESVLFEGLDAMLNSLEDQLDWDPYQFPEALHTYLRASVDRNDMTQRLTKLFDLYKNTEGGHNLTLILLQTPLVRSVISQDAALFTKVVGPWLPQYPPPDKPLEPITFNLFDLMPPILDADTYGMDTLVKALQNPYMCNDDKLTYFCGIFDGENSCPPQVDLPNPIVRRVAVLSVAWIMSILKIPTDIALETEDIGDPVFYAIRYVRVADQVLKTRPSGTLATSMFSQIIYILSPDQISLLLRVVFTAEMVEANLTLMMCVLKIVRQLARPGIALDQVWQVLNLPQMSSWHRMALTNTILRHQDPQGARSLVRRLLVFNKDGRESRKLIPSEPSIPRKEEAVEHVMEQDQDVREGELSGDAVTKETEVIEEAKKANPTKKSDEALNFYKVTTEKMVIQVLCEAFEHGILNFDDIDGYAQTNMLSVSPSIVSSVSDILAKVVIQTWLLYGDDKVGIWDLLKPYMRIAERVSETQEITDEQWVAARARSIPMPMVVEQYPVAKSLLRDGTTYLPSILRRAWTVNVVEPVLLGHVNARTTWLKAAVAREGGSTELEVNIVATHSSAINFAATYRVFAPWFSYERTCDQEPVIRIIQSRVAPASARTACQAFLDLVGQNHSGFWRGTVYGRAVVSMTAYATRDESGDEGIALGTALLSPISSGDNIPLWLVDRISSTLIAIAVELLYPDNVMFDPRQEVDKIRPLDAFMRFFEAHMSWGRKESKQIRELCFKYVEEAQKQEKMKSLQSLNGGAMYWKTIVELKLAVSFSHDTVDGLAGALAEVVSIITNGWYSCLHLPEIVQRVFQFPSHHLALIGLVPFVDTFTQPPYCPSEPGLVRDLTFQTAFAVLRANRRAVEVDLSTKREMKQLINNWKNHEDGSIQWLAQTFQL